MPTLFAIKIGENGLASTRAKMLITRLVELYPRRPAMLEELTKLKLEKKLNK